MKALLLKERGKFVYTDLPTPEPREGEVQIRIKAVAICGSDVHGYDGGSGRREPELIIGHEASGVISALGPGVTGLREGDRVVFNSVRYCGTCWYCTHGLENMCSNGCCYGIRTDAQHLDGAMAEYLCVPARLCYPIPEGVSFESAALIEPLAIAVHAVNGAPIRINGTAAVFGAGVMGLMMLKVLKASGCGRVISVEVDPFKKEMARKNGADAVIDGREDVPAQIRALTGGLGADFAIETASLKATIQNAFRSVKKTGTVIQVGNIAPEVEAPLQLLVNNEIHWIGRYGTFDEYEAALALLASGKVGVEDCLSAAAPLQEGQLWFDRLRAAREPLLKVVLLP